MEVVSGGRNAAVLKHRQAYQIAERNLSKDHEGNSSGQPYPTELFQAAPSNCGIWIGLNGAMSDSQRHSFAAVKNTHLGLCAQGRTRQGTRARD